MSKKEKGGKSKNKGSDDWVSEYSDAIRAKLPGEGEIFGVVVQILGAGYLLVNCLDGNLRKIRIPGRFRKRMWCRVGDLVIVMPNYGMSHPEERGELVHRFRRNEVRWLVNQGYVPEDFVNM